MMEKKKIGLIQIDGKMPNLALMKLASFHKKQGDEVFLIDLSSLNIDQWYGSKIFMGGSGYNIKQKLPKEIEVQVPDYDLYNTDFSMGFTSRGCVRDCDFCIVKEKEGNLFECDFSKDIKHSKYILMDNNFLISPKWKEKLKFFIDNKIKVCFNQGLDIRFVTEEKAELLSKIKFYNRTFKERRIFFAFDDPTIENIFRKNLEILLKFIKPRQIMIYILVGFNTSFEQDMYRFQVVKNYGCDPYIMIFNNRKNKPILRHFARWVNKRLYKSCEFKDYNPIKNNLNLIKLYEKQT